MITNEQYERWKDFALRMARTCFKRRRNPTAAEIETNVEFFFDCLDEEDLLSIVDWDNSDPYPEGSQHYRRTYKCPCWHCHGVKKIDCPYPKICEDGHIYDYETAMLVTDMCTEHAKAWNPHYWEDLSDAEDERRDDQFCGPVRCCIRAGLDTAVSPSAGVLGFTAGDLRKMYPEGVPDWISGGKDHRWVYAFTGEINGTFAAMPDSAGVLL
jgi:hypothetical protein